MINIIDEGDDKISLVEEKLQVCDSLEKHIARFKKTDRYSAADATSKGRVETLENNMKETVQRLKSDLTRMKQEKNRVRNWICYGIGGILLAGGAWLIKDIYRS